MKDAMYVFGMVILVISVLSVFIGIVDAGPNSKCDGPKARIEYVLPAYRIGCWLGSPVGSK